MSYSVHLTKSLSYYSEVFGALAKTCNRFYLYKTGILTEFFYLSVDIKLTRAKGKVAGLSVTVMQMKMHELIGIFFKNVGILKSEAYLVTYVKSKTENAARKEELKRLKLTLGKGIGIYVFNSYLKSSVTYLLLAHGDKLAYTLKVLVTVNVGKKNYLTGKSHVNPLQKMHIDNRNIKLESESDALSHLLKIALRNVLIKIKGIHLLIRVDGIE